jgi:prepilin-type N-terminal cleavage/methylation domain-containing protein
MLRAPLRPTANPHPATTGRRHGFTLVEVLVVVTVIGLLAAVAIPKFSGSKDKAYVAAMKADLHTAAVYEEGYATENRGQYFSGVATEESFVQGFRPSKGVTVEFYAVNILGSQLSEWRAVARNSQSPNVCEMRAGVITCSTDFVQPTGIIAGN